MVGLGRHLAGVSIVREYLALPPWGHPCVAALVGNRGHDAWEGVDDALRTALSATLPFEVVAAPSLSGLGSLLARGDIYTRASMGQGGDRHAEVASTRRRPICDEVNDWKPLFQVEDGR